MPALASSDAHETRVNRSAPRPTEYQIEVASFPGHAGLSLVLELPREIQAGEQMTWREAFHHGCAELSALVEEV